MSQNPLTFAEFEAATRAPVRLGQSSSPSPASPPSWKWEGPMTPQGLDLLIAEAHGDSRPPFSPPPLRCVPRRLGAWPWGWPQPIE